MKEFIEKLIARLEEELLNLTFQKTERNKGFNDGIHKGVKIVNQLAEEHKGGWIPCCERLPEENGEYIVMIERATRPTFLNYYAGAWFGWDEDGIEYYEVVAWQPLPEPYKEG